MKDLNSVPSTAVDSVPGLLTHRLPPGTTVTLPGPLIPCHGYFACSTNTDAWYKSKVVSVGIREDDFCESSITLFQQCL